LDGLSLSIVLNLQPMTTTINISLPDSLKSFIDERIKSRGYDSYSEYLSDLVRKDELDAAKEKLRERLAEGLQSPVGRTWEELKDSYSDHV